ncbi:MAG: formylglycine-generating enzyme family protein, partial [Microcystaceae cyanobacterium]
GRNYIQFNQINNLPIIASDTTEILPGGIILEMIKIPAGSFMMGSNEYDNEKPPHQVTLKEFYLGKYPVTQEQYQAVMGENPSHFKDNPKNPVEQVSWDDAKAFCQKLQELTGKSFRLPTEAEWEYACRAGSQTRYYFGDDESQLGDYAWYNANSDSKTHPVGQKKPNAWGLYDTHGNVWEWCEDPWHYNYAEKPQNIKDNGNTIWSSDNESYRVLRGGSWLGNPRDCRSACRFLIAYRFDRFGFRVVSPH